MIRVKGWNTFQSYKDRKPPWIRLHKALLDNFKFHKMSVNARALLPMIWLLASEDSDPVSGLLRIGYEEISFRLRMSKNDVIDGISECIEAEFLEEIDETGQLVTNPLRNCHETVTPETETETETEKKKKNTKKEKTKIPDWVPSEAWEGYCQHRGKKFTENAKRLAIGKLERWRAQGYDIEEILNQSVMNGWAGLFEIRKGNGNERSTSRNYRAQRALAEGAAELEAEWSGRAVAEVDIPKLPSF